MNMTTTTALRMAFLAAAGAAACACAPHAGADDNVQSQLGGQADVGDGQQWTVTALQPSTDPIPYQPAGSLWEATATNAPAGGGIPIVPGFSARSASGESYPVLWTVPAPLGINPSALPAGGQATGRLYFDVTGPTPDRLAYTRDGQDVAVWVQPPPLAAGGAAAWPAGTASGTLPLARTTPAAPVPAQLTPQPPAATGSSTPPPAAASAGTPLPSAGSSGTPLPATTGSSGTPAVAGPATAAPAAATPASTPPSPAPAGTPTPTTAAPTPTTVTPAPNTGSSGTPLTAPTTTPVPAPGS